MTVETEVKKLVELCRELGVSHYEGPMGDHPHVKLVLDPVPQVPEEPEPVKPVDNPTPEVKTSKLGKDLLTAEQQLELYGRVLDAEE